MTTRKGKKITVTQKPRRDSARPARRRGRPSKVPITEPLHGPHEPDNGEKRAFTLNQAVAVAKEWIVQSRIGPNQHEKTMYDKITDNCTRIHDMDRSVSSVKSFC